MSEDEFTEKPYEIAGQLKLFKAGLMGNAVTIWSKHKDGEKSQLQLRSGEPLVVTLDSEDPEGELVFAGAYIMGWNEGTGGNLEDLEIWIEPL